MSIKTWSVGYPQGSCLTNRVWGYTLSVGRDTINNLTKYMVDQKLKKRALHRAKILRGQFDGLVKAIEKETYCPTLLEQSLSIQKSLTSLDSFLLENHLRSHVRHQMQTKGSDEKAVKELIRIYNLSNR